MGPKDRIKDYLAEQEMAAMKKYNDQFDSASYNHATNGKSAKYANDLIDEAMALCGSPYHKVSIGRKWSPAALVHLSAFAR